MQFYSLVTLYLFRLIRFKPELGSSAVPLVHNTLFNFLFLFKICSDQNYTLNYCLDNKSYTPKSQRSLDSVYFQCFNIFSRKTVIDHNTVFIMLNRQVITHWIVLLSFPCLHLLPSIRNKLQILICQSEEHFINGQVTIF